MSTAIPTSTSVVESSVIKAPLSHVWHFIKRKPPSPRTPPSCDPADRIVRDFQKFWTALKGSEAVDSQEETDVVRWTFQDGTVLEVKQEEHSVGLPPTPWLRLHPDPFQTINHYITYSVITSKSELSYTSVVSTIR